MGHIRLKAASDEMLTLDFLRFYASAAIVFHHSHEFLTPAPLRPAIAERTAGLALFVDLFFLISGFVIAHVYSGKVGSLPQFGRFMQRRVGRLVPLHLLTLILAIAMWAIVVRFSHPLHVPSTNPVCIALTATLLHGLIGCGNDIFYNGVSWSISVEMAMYVLFPLLAMLASRGARAYLFACLALLVWVMAWTFINNGSVGAWTDDLYRPLRGLSGFALGVALHGNRDLLKRIPAALPATWILLVATSVCAMIGANAPLQVVLFYALGIAGMATDCQRRAGSLITRLAPLGQLTYSMYLWHGFFIIVMLNAVADKHFGGNALVLALAFPVCYAAIIGWSYLSWSYFETPARRWIDNLFRKSPGLASASD